MKTNKAKEIVNKVDKAIPDLTFDDTVRHGTHILDHATGAAVCWACMKIHIAFAVVETAEMTVKGGKTIVKKTGKFVKDFYDRPVMVYK